ncbi:MAG: HugZ family protein [Persicimonas sp.]
MTNDSNERHDAGGIDSEHRRPSHATSARSLLVASNRGVLSTLDQRDGIPYGSLVEYAPLEEGDALFLLSDLAAHTTNFKRDERASLFVATGLSEGRPLALERATLMGAIEEVEPDDDLREVYLDEHPQVRGYVDFSDFGFWRLRVERVRYIGGFGRMSWVDGEAYGDADPDPLAEAAAGAIDHMNRDHGDALLDYVRAFSKVDQPSEPHMVALDQFGFDVQVRNADGRQKKVRISFEQPLDDPSALRSTMVELVERARRQLD